MSDQVDKPENGQEQPAPQADAASSAEPQAQAVNLPAGDELVRLVQNDPQALEALRRQLQSQKDKGVAQATKKAQEALDIAQQIAARLGASDDEYNAARRDVLVDQLLEQQFGGAGGEQAAPGSVPSGGTPPAAQAPASSTDYHKVIQESGLDANDPEVLKAVIDYGTNPVDLGIRLGAIKVQRENQTPASPATVVQPGGGEARSVSTPAEVQRQIDALLADRNAMLTKEGREKLAELRQKLDNG